MSRVKWLLARRLAQLGFLGLFLAGVAKGTLASSLTLKLLPLTDPLIALQELLAHHSLSATVLIGSAIVLVAYALLGGRAYCAWVCPVNLITDFAAWARARLGLTQSIALDRRIRFWLLAGILVASAVTGTVAWEFINPVTMVHRALVMGSVASGAVAALAIFLFDFGIAARGWCGHLCPVGAFYGLVGAKSLIRVSAARRSACDNCMDCFAVCPERQVIAPALRGADKGVGPVILSSDCSNCGRCIDVCSKQVFRFGTRFAAGDE